MLSAVDAKHHILALTGLRGIAALWVMLCHCWYYLGMPDLRIGLIDLGKFMALGWIGVLIFFLLSGFLLAQPFVAWRRDGAARPDIGIYLMRRWLRVFPAYYVQLAVLVALAWLIQGVWLFPDWRVALAHLFMFFNIGPQPVQPVVGVWWTLPVEFGFYLTLPLLAFLSGKRVGVWLLVGVGFAVSMFHHYLGWLWLNDQAIIDRSNFVVQLPGYLVIFVLGCAGCWYRDGVMAMFSRNRLLSSWLAVASIATLVALMYVIPLENGGAEFWDSRLFYYLWKPAAGVAVLGLVLACLDRQLIIARALGGRMAVILGDISYSLYLWHLPIILFVRDWAPRLGLGSMAVGRAVGPSSLLAFRSIC